jgi:ATP-dependent exoDNAse (exonuclease V) beta subunit
MPMRHAKKDWEREAEENLIYVAVTRCKKTLNYIKEDEQWKKAYEQNIYLGMIKDKIRHGEETPTAINIKKTTGQHGNNETKKPKAANKYKKLFQ